MVSSAGSSSRSLENFVSILKSARTFSSDERSMLESMAAELLSESENEASEGTFGIANVVAAVR